MDSKKLCGPSTSPVHTNRPRKTVFGFKEEINEVQMNLCSFSFKMLPLNFTGSLIFMKFSERVARLLFENIVRRLL